MVWIWFALGRGLLQGPKGQGQEGPAPPAFAGERPAKRSLQK